MVHPLRAGEFGLNQEHIFLELKIMIGHDV